MSLTAAVMLQAALLSATTDYAVAHKSMQETGQPLVVLVAADWCGACQQMKTSVIGQLRQRGALSGVAFSIVDVDAQRQLAGQLMSGGLIPQLVVYHKTSSGWRRHRLVGVQSPDTIEALIHQAISESTAEVVKTVVEK